MNKGKIGVQMMVLKEKVEQLGAYSTMKKLYELGYSAVEVSKIPMNELNVTEIKKASEDFNIEITAVSAPLEPMLAGASEETLRDNFDKIVNDCKRLNCGFIRIGMLPLSIMGNKDEILNFIDRAETMAHKLEEYNIELYYHTHHIEFQKYNGEYLLDMIKNNTTKLGFELDVHWIQRAGENPVEFIKKYKDRISLLHLKDYRIGSLNITEKDLNDTDKFFEKFTNIIEFAEIGEGNLDIPKIINTGLDNGVKYFLIEQDDTYGRDPFESLEISANNLRSLGYESWF